MANQFLQLSLFLMLLSFFIVLNGMSAFEDAKVRPVMNSLLGTFSNDVVDEVHVEDYQMGSFIDDNATRKADTLEVVEGLFNAHLSGFEANRNRLGTVLHIRLPVWKFRNAITLSNLASYNFKTSSGSEGAFLKTMISLLRSDTEGKPYRVDMVLNIKNDPARFSSQSPEEFGNALKSVTEFSAILEAEGFPRRMMSAGLALGEAGMIDIYFSAYKSFDLVSAIQDQEP